MAVVLMETPTDTDMTGIICGPGFAFRRRELPETSPGFWPPRGLRAPVAGRLPCARGCQPEAAASSWPSGCRRGQILWCLGCFCSRDPGLPALVFCSCRCPQTPCTRDTTFPWQPVCLNQGPAEGSQL